MPKYENLTARVLVALVAIPLILWLTMLGGYYFFFLIAVISTLTLYEFYGLAETKGAARAAGRRGARDDRRAACAGDCD